MNVSREYRIFFRSAKETLIDCHRYSREHNNTPTETVELLIDAIGKESAEEIVAALILCKGSWDERISRASRSWAAETCCHSIEDLNTVPGIYYCDEIHPAHMEQIAQVLRNRRVPS